MAHLPRSPPAIPDARTKSPVNPILNRHRPRVNRSQHVICLLYCKERRPEDAYHSAKASGMQKVGWCCPATQLPVDLTAYQPDLCDLRFA